MYLHLGISVQLSLYFIFLFSCLNIRQYVQQQQIIIIIKIILSYNPHLLRKMLNVLAVLLLFTIFHSVPMKSIFYFYLKFQFQFFTLNEKKKYFANFLVTSRKHLFYFSFIYFFDKMKVFQFQVEQRTLLLHNSNKNRKVFLGSKHL